MQGKNQTRVPVPFAEWTSRYPAGFVMKGGEITKNLAYSVGGGLSISTGQAELHGGLIANNSAGDQGGGVYVTAVPYALKVYDAYISDNLAKEDTWIQSTGVLEEGVLYELSLGSGGGIWFCPTGDAKIYIENGAAIFGNTATNAGDDFHNEDKVPGHYTVTLPTRTANGIRILWYEDDKGNRYDANDPHLVEKLRHIAEPLSLKAILADGLTEMRDLYKLFVTGNMANKGGGFGSNGTIIFGYPPTEENPLREITVTKVWTDVPSSAIPEEVVIWMTIGGHKAERIVLNAANDWKATLHDLPATIQGKPIESLIGFEEETAGDWTFRVSSIRERGAAYENEYEEWILPLAVTLSNSGDVPKKPMLQIRKSWVGEGVIPNRIDVVLTIEGHSETFFLTKDNGWLADIPLPSGVDPKDIQLEEIVVPGWTGEVGRIEAVTELLYVVLLTNTETPEKPPVIPPDEPEDPPEIPEQPPVIPPETPEQPKTPPVIPPETPKQPEKPVPVEPKPPKTDRSPPVTAQPADTKTIPQTGNTVPVSAVWLLMMGVGTLLGGIRLRRR